MSHDYVRSPSLRELRANMPGNVAILPTAASRKVQQRYNERSRRARRALRDSQAQSFPYRHPHLRAEEPYARALLDHGRSAEMILLMEILQELPQEARKRVRDRLNLRQTKTSESLKAYAFARLTDMTIGDRCALDAEMERQQ